ncbi:hypothetical protein HZB02_01545 [Candidatus Woesearchaeota archaeon]|nr:hypothetical protein [Candidatus Woesearchaeota archaeon]
MSTLTRWFGKAESLSELVGYAMQCYNNISTMLVYGLHGEQREHQFKNGTEVAINIGIEGLVEIPYNHTLPKDPVCIIRVIETVRRSAWGTFEVRSPTLTYRENLFRLCNHLNILPSSGFQDPLGKALYSAVQLAEMIEAAMDKRADIPINFGESNYRCSSRPAFWFCDGEPLETINVALENYRMSVAHQIPVTRKWEDPNYLKASSIYLHHLLLKA